jgi:tetratricopeptide (TPR) repeat protein
VFGKLFGKAKDTGRQEPKAADTIRVYDEYGRERLVTRENWRANVLPAAIEASWNNPEQLYANIVQALRDGFRPEIVYAAEHLYQIDPQKSRGAAAWGIVLMEEGRLEEAESVFQEFLSRHGDDGVVLTNLAKVYSKRNDEVKSQATLWHALEIDPNLDNGLAWYGAIHRDRGGDQAWLEAMQKVASLPGSWRAQLWLARDALQATHKDEAMALYRSAFERLPVPVPADFLLQITAIWAVQDFCAKQSRLASLVLCRKSMVWRSATT